jgi:hypothetical protein
MTHFPQPPSLESKSPRFGIKDPKELWHAIYDDKDLMVKMGKIGPEIRKPLFLGRTTVQIKSFSLSQWLDKISGLKI